MKIYVQYNYIQLIKLFMNDKITWVEDIKEYTLPKNFIGIDVTNPIFKASLRKIEKRRNTEDWDELIHLFKYISWLSSEDEFNTNKRFRSPNRFLSYEITTEINWETISLNPDSELYFDFKESWIKKLKDIEIRKTKDKKFLAKLSIREFIKIFLKNPAFNAYINDEVFISSQKSNEISSEIAWVKGKSQELLEQENNSSLNYLQISPEDLVFVSLTRYWKELYTWEYIQNTNWKTPMSLNDFLSLLIKDESGDSTSPSKVLSSNSFEISVWLNFVEIDSNTDILLKLSEEWENILESKDVSKKPKIAQENWYTRFSFNDFKDLFWKELINNSFSSLLGPNEKIIFSPKIKKLKTLD